MRNFNVGREIDMRAYLPRMLRDVKEFGAIVDAEEPEIETLWQSCEDGMNDQFITEATESGIARREKMLGVTPFATDTLDDRRFRLLTKYCENVPYTRRNLETMLATLCGTDGYQLTIATAAFSVYVKVALSVRKQENCIKELLERILPFNMVYTVELLFNTWEKVHTYTWGTASALTWQGLKEEGAS